MVFVAELKEEAPAVPVLDEAAAAEARARESAALEALASTTSVLQAKKVGGPSVLDDIPQGYDPGLGGSGPRGRVSALPSGGPERIEAARELAARRGRAFGRAHSPKRVSPKRSPKRGSPPRRLDAHTESLYSQRLSPPRLPKRKGPTLGSAQRKTVRSPLRPRACP